MTPRCILYTEHSLLLKLTKSQSNRGRFLQNLFQACQVDRSYTWCQDLSFSAVQREKWGSTSRWQFGVNFYLLVPPEVSLLHLQSPRAVIPSLLINRQKTTAHNLKLEHGWAVNFTKGTTWETGTGVKGCTSLYKLIDTALHNSPSFSCGLLVKLTAHPWVKVN